MNANAMMYSPRAFDMRNGVWQQLNKSLNLGATGMLSGNSNPALDMVFGGLPSDTFNKIQKALVATPSTPGGPGDGSSLIPQALARTLKNVTFKMKQIKLWRNIDKQEAYAMEEEYDQITAYGVRGGVFTSPMATPTGNDSTFIRQQVAMKYMSVAYATDIAIMATEVLGGSAEALQINNATRYLLSRVERELYYGSSALLPQAFDGVKQIVVNFANTYGFSNIVQDNKAQPITPDTLENAAQAIQDNAGDLQSGEYKAYMPPIVQSYFSKTFAPDQRYNFGSRALPGEGSLVVGTPVGGYNSTYGFIPFENDIFLNLIQPETQTIENAPAIPTNVSASLQTNVSGSLWTTPASPSQYGVGYAGGPVSYMVSAVNNFGESLPSAATTPVVVAGGDAVQITWNRVTGTNGANYYQLYRSMNGGPFLPLTRVPDAGTGVQQQYTDLNVTVAGTFDIFLINHDAEEGLVFKQLLPFFKWPLPIPALARYFAVALIGAPIIYVPSRCVVITNVQIPNAPIAPVLLS